MQGLRKTKDVDTLNKSKDHEMIRKFQFANTVLRENMLSICIKSCTSNASILSCDLPDVALYSCDAEFIQVFWKQIKICKRDTTIPRSCLKFGDYVYKEYHMVFFMHWPSPINWQWGPNIRTQLCVKRDDFNLSILNYPYMSINIPKVTTYGLYIPQLLFQWNCKYILVSTLLFAWY